MDKYSCKCGQKYTSNSSLYNHIRLKHDNDMAMKSNQLKMGRPIGTKNEFPIKKQILKRVPYPCKCGANLASRGALSNHWRLVHKNIEEFKPDQLDKGRKRIYPDQTSQIDIIQTKQESTDSSGNQHDQSISTHITFHEELDQKLIGKQSIKDDKIHVKYESNDVDVNQQTIMTPIQSQNGQKQQQLQQQYLQTQQISKNTKYDFYQQMNGQLINNQQHPFFLYNFPKINPNSNYHQQSNFHQYDANFFHPSMYYNNIQLSSLQPQQFIMDQHYEQYIQGFNLKNPYCSLIPQSQQRINF